MLSTQKYGENLHVNYSPFGAILYGRNWSSEEYRYGFQGQERDDEMKGEGNSVNFTYRMHDPRLGRFFALDPLSYKYPFYSPYHFASNSPILATELEGLQSSVIVNYTEGSIKIDKDQQTGVFNINTDQLALLSRLGGKYAITNESERIEPGGTMSVRCDDCPSKHVTSGSFYTIYLPKVNVVRTETYVETETLPGEKGSPSITQDIDYKQNFPISRLDPDNYSDVLSRTVRTIQNYDAAPVSHPTVGRTTSTPILYVDISRASGLESTFTKGLNSRLSKSIRIQTLQPNEYDARFAEYRGTGPSPAAFLGVMSTHTDIIRDAIPNKPETSIEVTKTRTVTLSPIEIID